MHCTCWHRLLVACLLKFVFCSMPTAKLDSIKCVGLPGCSRVWKISESSGDIITCEDRSFVRVCPTSHTLAALVLEDNPHAGDAVAGAVKKKTISDSTGLANLLKLRNDSQAHLLQGAEGLPGEGLFDVQQGPKKRRRSAHEKIAREKDNFASLTITVTVADEQESITVLKPFHPNDNLFVEYEERALGALISYLRQEGFDDKQLRARHDRSLPTGIRARKDEAYTVVYKKANGSKGFKKCESIETAVAFKSNPQDFVNALEQGEPVQEDQAESNDDEAEALEDQAGAGEEQAEAGENQPEAENVEDNGLEEQPEAESM